MPNCNHVSIVGMQRSGTTAMLRAFCRHPDLFGLANEWQIVNIKDDVWFSHVNAKFSTAEIERKFSRETVATIQDMVQRKLVEAHFDTLDFLHNEKPIACKGIYLYQQFKFAASLERGHLLVMLRHPLAMLSSVYRNCLNLSQKGWTYALRRTAVIKYTFNEWVQFVGEVVGVSSPLVKVVKYEDLCSNPEDTLNGITEWLGISKFELPHSLFHSGSVRLWEQGPVAGCLELVKRRLDLLDAARQVGYTLWRS